MFGRAKQKKRALKKSIVTENATREVGAGQQRFGDAQDHVSNAQAEDNEREIQRFKRDSKRWFETFLHDACFASNLD